MKKLLVIGLAVSLVLVLAAGALAFTVIDVVVDTQGSTWLDQTIRTDFVLDLEMVTYTPFNGDGQFDLHSNMISVPTAGWPTPGGLTGFKTIDAYGGTTGFLEGAVGGGYPGANGFISEYIHNEGEIHIVKNIVNLGEWGLIEEKWITGSGLTTIEKDIGTWGLDIGSLHPTDAGALIQFSSNPSVISYTADYENDGVGGFYVTSLPSYEDALGWCFSGSMNDDIEYFESQITTTEPFIYHEYVAIDPYWPDIEPPERPVL